MKRLRELLPLQLLFAPSDEQPWDFSYQPLLAALMFEHCKPHVYNKTNKHENTRFLFHLITETAYGCI